VRTAVHDSIELVAREARGKGLDIECHVDSRVPEMVLGDPVRFRQIVINLANNAVKFTTTGTVMVRVEMEGESEAEVVVRTAVIDTGVGVDKAVRDRIFDVFSQADTSTTRRFGGTGLGLAIVKQLAGLMGGTVGLDSELGRGSTFWFTARLQKAQSKTTRVSELSGQRSMDAGRAALDGDGHKKAGATARQARIRVLLAEDNLINQRVAVRMLEKLGCEVEVVMKGEDAVEAWAAGSFDLVLMDCQMSGMDGYTATTTIRTLEAERGTHVPIVAFTAQVLKEDVERCRRAGMDDYLSKPVSMDALSAALDRWAW
jgi:CheY-like chemotaxis protein